MSTVSVQAKWQALQQLPIRWRFVRSVAMLSGGTVAAQALNLLLAPVISRLYVPADVGSLGVFVSFINVASIAVALSYEMGIVSAASEREAAGLVLMAGAFTIPVSVILGTILHFLIKYSVLGFGVLPAYAAPVTVAALVLACAFTTLRYWMVRRESYSLIAQSTVLQQGVRIVTQAALGVLGSSTAGLLSGELAGRATGMERMFQDALPSLRRQLSGVTARELRGYLRRNRTFPVFTLPSSIIDAVCANMIVPLIVLLYGSATGGQFALVSRVLSVPLVLIAISVADVFHSRMAAHAREHPLSCSSLFWRTSFGLLLLGSIPTAMIVFFGDTLFVVVFGKSWAPAGAVAVAMAPWFLAQFVVNPLSRLVLVLRGQELKLVYDVFTACSLVAVFWSARHHRWPVMQTIHWLVAVNVAAYAIYFLLLVLVVRRAPRQASAETQLGSDYSAEPLLVREETE